MFAVSIACRIEDEAALARVEVCEQQAALWPLGCARFQVADGVAGGRLDLDHVCAPGREEARAKSARDVVTQIDDADARKHRAGGVLVVVHARSPSNAVWVGTIRIAGVGEHRANRGLQSVFARTVFGHEPTRSIAHRPRGAYSSVHISPAPE